MVAIILLMGRRILFLVGFLLAGLSPIILSAQQAVPFILNGSSIEESCNCYQLTANEKNQAGSVWNKNLIDLSESFNYVFNVFLGCADVGADGIAFVLQPVGTNLGGNGSGIGFQNIIPSIGIPIDTYQNVENNDPPFDHIGIFKNGDLKIGTANTLAYPVQALVDSPNIEDCNWHTFRITWDAQAMILSAKIDSVPRVQVHLDLVKDIFGGNPKVYWGFTSATGNQSNVQKFCTFVKADFTTAENQNFCAPADVDFVDRSTSTGNEVTWFWDFGDGTKFNGENPPPHNYPEPGSYLVSLNLKTSDGCTSDTVTTDLAIYQTDAKTGDDTTVISGQPFQLHASGGEYYQWSPAEFLSDPTIADPVATINGNMQYILKAYLSEGCPTYDTINIKVYKEDLGVSVPNAFSPDNNGINDRFHPVITSISSIEHFEVFNRYGQKVYDSQGIGQGWDGTFNGHPQPVGTYIWLIKGRDYLGNPHSAKGTVVLIR